MIVLHESRHLREAGFFRFLFSALRRCGEDVRVDDSRPVEPWRDERGEHDGAWVTWNGKRLFFDMSDHVFQFDLGAWRVADLYFKANLVRSIASEVLESTGETPDNRRLRAFCFFPPSLPNCARLRALSRILPFGGPSICHIVGVYENPFLRNEEISAPAAGETLMPNEMHFWIRKIVADAADDHFPGAFSRLTSRGNRKIEDGLVVRPNLPHWQFLWKLMMARICLLNTYPHAVYPWKAFESLALGVPFVVESEPLIEIPKAFRPIRGEHFLEILPGNARFKAGFNLDDPSTYRTVKFPGFEAIRQGVENLASVVADSEIMLRMKSNARQFAREQLSDSRLFAWLSEEVEAL